MFQTKIFWKMSKSLYFLKIAIFGENIGNTSKKKIPMFRITTWILASIQPFLNVIVWFFKKILKLSAVCAICWFVYSNETSQTHSVTKLSINITQQHIAGIACILLRLKLCIECWKSSHMIYVSFKTKWKHT